MHAMLSRFSRVRLCATPWTAAHQAPLSTGFSRQEYWSGLPFPSPICKYLFTYLCLVLRANEENSYNSGHSVKNIQKQFCGKLILLCSANSGDTGDMGLIPRSGRSPGEGNGNPLQYSCLENPRDRGAWWGTIHKVTKSWTRLSN